MSQLLKVQKNQITIPKLNFPTIFQVVLKDMQADEQDQVVQSNCENCQQLKDKKISSDFYQLLDQNQHPNSKQYAEFSQEGVINILIYSNIDEECKEFLEKLIIKLSKEKCNIFIEDQSLDQNQQFLNKSKFILKLNQLYFISLIIILGGDEDILRILKQLQTQNIPPILTFQVEANTFSCEFEKNNMDKILEDQIHHFRIHNKFNTKRKIRIEGILKQGNLIKFQYHALNEFVISGESNTNFLFIEIYINNNLLTISSGDGIIISTPTGSPAYFLSAGGPIIQSDVHSISIVPICPLSLSFRPIILPPCINITIKLSNISRSNGVISADGQQTFEFSKDMIFEIKNSSYGIDLIEKDQTNYSDWINSLRTKLFWNTMITE
ncbi:unnamed protein product [Paramecium primaurelia]|uniref:NAD(+) kinase n=1 Tax=Paramecium primaurelia TaxID=5886 RepID=A0A8S1L773_PARPR|nr:unnamed protein product [Paramecium primaurelia]